MGRGMRWSPISRGKYSSVPSHNNETHPGDIELSECYHSDGEDEEDAHLVPAASQTKKWGLAVATTASVALISFITITLINDNPSKRLAGVYIADTIEFPSNVLFGSELAVGEMPTIESRDISPPYDVHHDFRNELGNTPPYWEEIEHIANVNGSFSNVTSWGPCYQPNMKDDWRDLTLLETSYRYSNDEITYKNSPRGHGGKTEQTRFYSGSDDTQHNPNLAGFCRPGYIIIGQAKCGTSSLYHYLIGHPRVLPAKQKQLDYFKYLSYMPMEWYLSNFPSAETFLARGALMTGESSPSYFPYPEVPHLIHERTRAQGQPHPKIIAIVRDPISRSMSSYKYNYVDPALKMLLERPKNPKANAALYNITEGMSEEYYMEHHLFTFEELVRAEIKVLQECLKPGGLADQKSREKYGPPDGIYAVDFSNPVTSLVNADEFCYGKSVSGGVPLPQWKDLIRQNPHKIIVGLDYHLVRSIVGRSLYSLFMNWWYTRFSKDDIYVVCTEDLYLEPADTMLNVSLFLGLPSFDFTNVTNEGMFNVGFHQGYNTVTTWDTVNEEEENSHDQNELSDELRNELLDFFRPYNEDLFKITGKTCQWETVRF